MANFKERMAKGEAMIEAEGPDTLLVRQRQYDPNTAERLANNTTQTSPQALRDNIARLQETEDAVRQEREDAEFILAEGLKLIEKEFPKSKKGEH